MMHLIQERQKKARALVYEHARPLERRLFSYHFREGAAGDVFAELARYQNFDGGFGHALEPDLRLPDSSAIATTVGLQILRELKARCEEGVERDSHREGPQALAEFRPS